jgi:hypothetical protein
MRVMSTVSNAFGVLFVDSRRQPQNAERSLSRLLAGRLHMKKMSDCRTKFFAVAHMQSPCDCGGGSGWGLFFIGAADSSFWGWMRTTAARGES